jgi:hypothetical protein
MSSRGMGTPPHLRPTSGEEERALWLCRRGLHVVGQCVYRGCPGRRTARKMNSTDLTAPVGQRHPAPAAAGA